MGPRPSCYTDENTPKPSKILAFCPWWKYNRCYQIVATQDEDDRKEWMEHVRSHWQGDLGTLRCPIHFPHCDQSPEWIHRNFGGFPFKQNNLLIFTALGPDDEEQENNFKRLMDHILEHIEAAGDQKLFHEVTDDDRDVVRALWPEIYDARHVPESPAQRPWSTTLSRRHLSDTAKF